MTHPVAKQGFTLAELLIGLGLLGVLTVMAIPAILGQGSKVNTNVGVVKDAALTIAAAYAQYLQTGYADMTGTVSVTNGSPTITGTGTTFTQDYAVGDRIRLSNGTTHIIASIASATQMTSTSNFTATVSGMSYGRVRDVPGDAYFKDIVSKITYLVTDTSTNASTVPTGEFSLDACSTTLPCLQLHSGALIQYSATSHFGTGTPDSYITLAIDPDGTGTTAGKVNLLLYANGKVITGDQAMAGGTTVAGVSPVSLVANPSWLTATEFGK